MLAEQIGEERPVMYKRLPKLLGSSLALPVSQMDIVGFLAATEGTEQVELTEPWAAVRREGGVPRLVSQQPGEITMFNPRLAAET